MRETTERPWQRRAWARVAMIPLLAACEGGSSAPQSSGPPDSTTNQFVHPAGDATSGQQVFRFETFGNEGFWTRAMELPQGMAAKHVTPLQALALGLSVDSDAVPADLMTKIAAELKTDLSAASAPTLNDPNATMALVEANAVLGFSARNVTSLNGTLDVDATNVYAGESVGATCAVCHSITDGSVYAGTTGGTIGKRMDGRTNHNLNFGAILALANHSRAYYPQQALDLVANNHGSVSRKGPGVGLISAAATEGEMDAYFNDAVLYPVGMFDDAPDGNGAPMHTTPLFRADLAAPWGSEGSIHMLQNFGNLVYTALLDPTDLISDGGRTFLMQRGGDAGLEIITNYTAILADLGVPAGGVNGYPFVGRAGKTDVTIGLAAGAKVEPSPIGMQVDQTKLVDMNAYLNGLAAPAGNKSDSASASRGRTLFRQQCTGCHNDDQSKFVPQDVVAFNRSVELFANALTRPPLYTSWAGKTVADRSAAGLDPVRDSAGIFDDKMIVIDASDYDQPRGATLPLLMDLARKPVFLHDSSVASLDDLLNPTKRTPADPHPFFIAGETDRGDVVQFLKSLDDQPLAGD